ncbi:hypothetical protein [Bifidobacterium myosotis]|uniref:DUF3987 domain-containing protein n=1 Tax=Bifidobacterium myosotis TaxID=1630166 RepID=A0A5M9ZSB2_9BIFI|nr:hypothetical protein [Bifidobacterium myosotis]KAA8829712.1 hypothetical protein EMO91_01690 [Bifidobacterium myosotis]
MIVAKVSELISEDENVTMSIAAETCRNDEGHGSSYGPDGSVLSASSGVISGEAESDLNDGDSRSTATSETVDVLSLEEPLSIQSDDGSNNNNSRLDAVTETKFWDARPWLQYIRDYARAIRVSPEGLLGAVLVRVSSMIRPSVVLKVTDYDNPMSLNLNVALVGAPGTGKGKLVSAARKLIPLPSGNPMLELKPKTGESIVSKFVSMVQDKDDKGKPIPKQYHPEIRTDRVELVQTEVNALGVSFKTDGSTMLVTLLQAFSNEYIGAETRAKSSSVVLPPYSYRLSSILGVQPSESHVIFDNSSVGFASRFIFVNAIDTAAPIQRPLMPKNQWTCDLTRFDSVDPFESLLRLLQVGGRESFVDPGKQYPLLEMTFPLVAKEQADSMQLKGVHGKIHELDAHRLELQSKVAALFCILDSRNLMRKCNVTAKDWSLAGTFMLMSDRARDFCLEERDRLERERRVKSILDGQLAKKAADADVSELYLIETEDKVIRCLKGHPDGLSGVDIRRRVNTKWRGYVKDAINRLHEDQRLEPVKQGSSEVVIWKLSSEE